jgi:DNA-binding NtrC family response regulator
MKTTNKLEVLVIDDDSAYNKALVNYLQEQYNDDISVTGFQSGEECLNSFEGKPKIVILDYFLNSRFSDAMNGISVLDIIKKKNPGTEVILISGQDKIDVAINAMRHGAYNYIVKGSSALPQIGRSTRSIMHTFKLRNDIKWARNSALATLAGVFLIVGFAIAIQIFAPALLNR